MASINSVLLCLAPVVLLLAGCDAALVSATVETGDPVPLEQLEAFAENLLNEADFAEEEALLETASVRDLVPFIRSAFSTDQQGTAKLLLPKEDAVEFFATLQKVERLDGETADVDTTPGADADKSVAQIEHGAHARNSNLVTSLLTKLVSNATLRNKTGEKISALLHVLAAIQQNADKVSKDLKSIAALMEELKELHARLVDLVDKFVDLVHDAIAAVNERWQATARGGHKAQVVDFLESLRSWAHAAKEVGQRKWQLIQELFTSSGTHCAEVLGPAEEGTAVVRTTAAEAAQNTGGTGYTDIDCCSLRLTSAGTLFKEAESARRIERDLAQRVWHRAAKCAQEGFVPLSFVRILLAES